MFKYRFDQYTWLNGQRIAATTGGTENSTYGIGIGSYIQVSKDNPIYIETADDVAYNVYFYTGNTQSTYLTHSGYLQTANIFNGSYCGIEYKAVRINIKLKSGSEYDSADALKAKIALYRLTNYKQGSPSGLTVVDHRFTVKINLNWPKVNSTSLDAGETETDTEILCIMRIPTTYSTVGKPTPLIMFGHGASAQITNDMWYGSSTNFQDMINAFVNAGYAVFDVNNTRNQSGGYPDWGSLPLMEAYIKAWEYIKANYNVEDKLYLFSCSMGTCANLNMLKWYGSKIVTSIMTAPRPICKVRYDSLTGTDKTNFETSFGITSSEWEDRLNGFNHYENIVTINNKPYVFEKFPPVKVMVGQSDSSFLEETRAYYQALANNGNFVNYREVADAGHDKMSFLSDSALRAEAVAWFDRFRYQETET